MIKWVWLRKIFQCILLSYPNHICKSSVVLELPVKFKVSLKETVTGNRNRESGAEVKE